MDRTDLAVPVFHQKRPVQSANDRVQKHETATTGLEASAPSVLSQDLARLSPEKTARVLKSCELKGIGPSSAEPPAYRLSRTLMSLESELHPEKTSLPTSTLTIPSIQPREIGTHRWCSHCNAHVRSVERKVTSAKTFLASAGIFLLGGVLGCFLAPYCSDECKDTAHYCTECELVIN